MNNRDGSKTFENIKDIDILRPGLKALEDANKLHQESIEMLLKLPEFDLSDDKIRKVNIMGEKFHVPLLTIVPIPNLMIDDINLDLDNVEMTLKKIHKDKINDTANKINENHSEKENQ